MNDRPDNLRRRKLDPANDVVLGGKNYLVYCDESGIGGDVYYGFGSLWMPHERRGDFSGLLGTLSDKFKYYDEVKWSNVNRRCLPFCKALVDEFFKRKWLMFHCVIVRKGYVNQELHKDFDEARRKHFAMLLKAKIKFFSRGHKDKNYYVRVDPLPSRYAKADEAAGKIVANQLKNDLGGVPLRSVVTRDSKETPGIQVADLLLGAVMCGWQRKAKSTQKSELVNHIAEHLDWPDLVADTHHHVWKFNIWNFHDPTATHDREIGTRPLREEWSLPRGSQ